MRSGGRVDVQFITNKSEGRNETDAQDEAHDLGDEGVEAGHDEEAAEDGGADVACGEDGGRVSAGNDGATTHVGVYADFHDRAAC